MNKNKVYNSNQYIQSAKSRYVYFFYLFIFFFFAKKSSHYTALHIPNSKLKQISNEKCQTSEISIKLTFWKKNFKYTWLDFTNHTATCIEVLITINVNIKINCKMLIISQKLYTRLLYLSWGIGLCLLITIVLLFGRRRKFDKNNGSSSNILGRRL